MKKIIQTTVLWVAATAAGFAHAGLPAGTDGICLYEHPDLLGAEWCYSADSPWIGDAANDKASSFRLYGNVAVTLYEGANYAGASTVVMMDSYQMSYLNDAVSSLRIAPRKRKDFACVFENVNYSGTGACAEAGHGIPYMPFYNAASSILIAGNAYVHGYAYDNYDTSHRHDSFYRSYGNLGSVGWNDDFDSFQVVNWDVASDSWDNRRRPTLVAQEQIATDSALFKSTWLGTHNAYNQEGYVKNFSGYNQLASLTEQLDMGARVLEIDIHGNGTVVYHTPEAGVVGARSSLTRYLVELNNWLKGADGDDVVFIKIEDLMDDGAQPEEFAAWNITKTLGDLVYRKPGNGQGCSPLPSNISIKDIAKSGKRIVFWSNKCGSDNANYMNIVWARGGAEGGRDTNWNAGCGDTPAGWGNAGNMSLINEDARWGAYLVGVGGQLPNNQLRSALECGMLHLMADQLDWNQSERFWAFAWAWPSGVNGNAGDCGLYQRDNKSLQGDGNCAATRHFVCRKTDDSIFVSNGIGAWNQGDGVCSSEVAGAAFSTPTNAREGRLLRDQQYAVGQVEDWINARRVGTDWVPHPDKQFFSLVEQRSGKCLDIPGNDDALFDGQKVQVWDCQANAADQKWYYDYSSGKLHNKANPNLCLDNRGQQYNGGSIGIYSCVDHINLQFDMVGEMIHTRGADPLVLNANDSYNGANVSSGDYTGAANQHWKKVY